MALIQPFDAFWYAHAALARGRALSDFELLQQVAVDTALAAGCTWPEFRASPAWASMRAVAQVRYYDP